MAIGLNALTSGGNGGSASGGFSTASIAPTGNALVVIAVHAADGSDPGTITVAGFGVTWNQQLDSYYDSTGTDGRLYVYTALMPASPGSDTIDVTFSNSSVTHQAWSVFEFTGVDQTTPIAQIATDEWTTTTTTFSVTLGTRAGNNATMYVWGYDDTASGTNDSAFTNIHAINQNRIMYTYYDLGGDQNPNTSLGSAARGTLFAMEITEAAGGSDRTARVSWAELEVPTAPRRAQLSWAEMEVPTAPRRAQVSWAELEVPTAPRTAQVSWAELEVPLAPRQAQLSWAELEVPATTRQVQLSWAELEVPTAPRQAQLSWAEMETPLPPRQAQLSWAELEVPTAPRQAQLSWAELEVPTAPRQAQVSWTEMETPLPPRQAQVSWAELEVPTAPRTAQISWAEMEVPVANRTARVSFAEFEVSDAPRQVQLSFAEFQVPTVSEGPGTRRPRRTHSKGHANLSTGWQ